MDSRPAKKQRRLPVRSDNQSEAATGDNPARSRGTTPVESSKNDTLRPSSRAPSSKSFILPSSRTKSSRIPSSHRGQSSTPSPEKRKHSKTVTDGTKSKSLRNFFQPASEEQRWASQKFETRFLDPVKEMADDDDDLIEDDYDSYDELFTKHFSDIKKDDSGSGQDRRSSSKGSSNSRKLTSKSFLMPSSSRRAPSQAPEAKVDDRRPWPQRFPPSTLDELAVHKKKVTDVQTWLGNAFTARNKRRLLVLRGPAGSGKTATISLLSKSMDFDVLEWKNPSVSDFAERGYTSVGAQFEEFLGRGNTFGGLDLDGAVETAEKRENYQTDFPRRVLLIEEFPTILSRTSSSLAAFRFAFQQYLAATDGLGDGADQLSAPIVIIVSETLLNSVSSVLDNLTVHRLLGPDLYNHPGTTIIDFNSIAPTFMNKALRLVLEKESHHSKRTKVPGQAVLKKVSEIGDIRSAISSLEFLSLKGDEPGARGGNLKAKKSARASAELTSMEKESLSMITQREASLGIFHSVGKVVYNKRDDPSLVPDAVPLPPPPDHLRYHDRRKISQVSVNDLVDETGTDIQTFISALHENYVLSCNGSFFTDCLNGCIDALSDSDILCAERRGRQGSRPGARMGTYNFNAGIDSLRQHEISYQVASRGLLFSLPHPVRRALPPANGRSYAGDAHKMLFPQSLRLWRESEEIDGLIDLWVTQLLSRSSRPSSARHNPCSGLGSLMQKDAQPHADYHDTRTMPVTMLSRDEMVLHQLPYMGRIVDSDSETRELARITGSHGVKTSDSGVDSDGFALDSWLGSRDPSQSLKSQRRQYGNTPAHSPVEGDEGKLILSDDDIED